MTRRLLAVAMLLVVLVAGAVGAVGLGVGARAQGLPPPVGPPPEEQPPPEQQPPPAETIEPAPGAEAEAEPQHPPLPPDSGSGRRVVYAVSEQRVWLVEEDERVSASWLVSGRRGIPKPGAYSVFSRSRWSSASGGRVRMEFMVRFVKTRGLAIGFHSIPVDRRGRQVQSEDELGQPRSRGCVRQRRSDAEHLWNWAPIGTAVRVTR